MARAAIRAASVHARCAAGRRARGCCARIRRAFPARAAWFRRPRSAVPPSLAPARPAKRGPRARRRAPTVAARARRLPAFWRAPGSACAASQSCACCHADRDCAGKKSCRPRCDSRIPGRRDNDRCSIRNGEGAAFPASRAGRAAPKRNCRACLKPTGAASRCQA